MKNFLALLLAAIMCVSLVACGGAPSGARTHLDDEALGEEIKLELLTALPDDFPLNEVTVKTEDSGRLSVWVTLLSDQEVTPENFASLVDTLRNLVIEKVENLYKINIQMDNDNGAMMLLFSYNNGSDVYGSLRDYRNAIPETVTISSVEELGSVATKEPKKQIKYTPDMLEEYLENSVQSEEPAQNTVTIGQTNALRSANSYLAYTAFSYRGLIEQLEYEGYSTADATYAANNCGANWNAQAAKMAQSYLDYTSFSRSSLIDQLEYEGFTYEQAVYGVEAVGY